MKWKIALAILAILVVATGFVLTVQAYIPDTPTVAQTQPKPPTPEELLRLVNEERAKVGVAPLALDPLLNKSAQIKAEDMYKNNYFGHVDAQGKHGYEYVKESGKACLIPSENIFWAKYDKSQTAVNWWMNSRPHKEAMLSTQYESVGFGISDWRVVAHFCDER